jgi:hypothetical protein
MKSIIIDNTEAQISEEGDLKTCITLSAIGFTSTILTLLTIKYAPHPENLILSIAFSALSLIYTTEGGKCCYDYYKDEQYQYINEGEGEDGEEGFFTLENPLNTQENIEYFEGN